MNLELWRQDILWLWSFLTKPCCTISGCLFLLGNINCRCILKWLSHHYWFHKLYRAGSHTDTSYSLTDLLPCTSQSSLFIVTPRGLYCSNQVGSATAQLSFTLHHRLATGYPSSLKHLKQVSSWCWRLAAGTENRPISFWRVNLKAPPTLIICCQTLSCSASRWRSTPWAEEQSCSVISTKTKTKKKKKNPPHGLFNLHRVASD